MRNTLNEDPHNSLLQKDSIGEGLILKEGRLYKISNEKQ